LRAMRPGDEVMIYHTGKEKAVIGLARVIGDDPKLGLVRIEAGRPLARPVTLAEIKADKAFADLGLVRMGRLSVMPVRETQWHRLLKLSVG
ncbi:MAG: EVE domain-containing protein, partial [Gemmatimonadales bacterium]